MSFSSWPYRMVLLVLACMAILPFASATIEYCSDINTSLNAQNSSIFQSNGLCSDFCRDDYAFAIVQDEGCWCSDYAPGTTTDTCTQTCPGYPADLCGGTDVYGYIALTVAVSGTKGATSSTAQAATSTTAAAAQVTVTEVSEPTTIIPDPQTVLVTVVPLTSSETSTTTTTTTSEEETTVAAATTSTTPTTSKTTTHTTTSSSISSSWTPTPVTSLETVTGQVRTVTVTPTVPPTAASTSTSTVSKSSSSSGSGLSTGAAVGLTIGLVALVAILSSIGYFCWRRRQKEKNAEYNDVSARQSGSGFAPVVPSRTMSESSRYVLNTDGRRVVETWEDDDAGAKGRSRMAVVDQRLDPFSKVYRSPAGNASRDSLNTVDDAQDYSRRVLRTTNPDPDATHAT